RSKHHKENHVNTRHWMRVLKGLILKSLYMMGISGEMHGSQQAWLKQRQKCKGDKTCLLQSYHQRINQLDTIYNSIQKPI
ncbi:hypothetical protein KKJ25_22065, partial [Xenorhabdus bovienii]|nr:hypothetical protein [Xenorhabdus bovienii]MDE9479787.1 hypothetical protein [Xenorhabdus bovienii]